MLFPVVNIKVSRLIWSFFNFFLVMLNFELISVRNIGAEERFTVVSYNILGDRNVSNHGDLYRNVSQTYLDWDHRKRVICEELLRLNPDIICLQVINNFHFG